MDSTNTQHLTGSDAIAKMQALVKSQSTCLFATHLTQLPLRVRPMHTLQVDDEGVFWFFSSTHSDKNNDLLINSRVQLFFSHPANSEFLSVYGTCGIVSDRVKIHELWTPLAAAWFPDGEDDAALSLLRVSPEEAHYWDTKHGSAVSFLKIVTAAISRTPTDSDGVHGDLHVR